MTPIEQVREALTKAIGFADSYQMHGHDEMYRAESSAVYDKLRAALAILKDMEAQEWPLTLGDRYMNPAGASVILRNPQAHPSPSAPVNLSEEYSQRKTCEAIIAKWGPEVQIAKIQEEALELALVLNQRNCPTKDLEKLDAALYDELADMKIMMMQAEILFDAARIADRVRYKFERVTTKYLNPPKP